MSPRFAWMSLALLAACGDDALGTSDAALPEQDGAPADAGADGRAGDGDAAASGDIALHGGVELRVENGMRIATFTSAPFTIEPSQERYVCQNFANPFGEDVAIVKSTSVMAEGSHHMFAFQKVVEDEALSDCSGLEFGPAAHSSQVPERTIEYPTGVARLHSASDGVRLQAHYLNVTSEPIEARVTVTLYAVETAGQALVASLFFNNVAISVAPHSDGMAEKTCTLPQDVELMNAISHMHRFGTHFEARLADGTLLYETNDWSEPEELKFDPPLHLPAGTTIRFRCDYTNPTESPLGFGESARTDEMCIFAGQFYPAPNGAITCM